MLEHTATANITRSVADQIRVLVLFGAVPLYGQERATIRLFEALRELGVEATFLTHGDYGHVHVEPELDRLGFAYRRAPYGPLLGGKFSLRHLWQIVRGIIGTNWALWREIRRVRPTHLFVMNPLYLLYASPSIFLSKLPLVYRIGDAPPRSRGYKILWKLLGLRATRLVANSDYIARLCRDTGFPADKIRRVYSSARTAIQGASGPISLHVVHYGIPFRRETVVLSPDPACLTALFVGQLVPNKGFDLAVTAVESLVQKGRSLRLLLAGDYCYERPDALAVKRRIEQTGMDKHIQFLGYVYNIVDLISIADIHLCPSLWAEPLSNTVLEAKSAGIPSIVFPRGGLPETVRHGIDGWLCQQQTAEGLEEALHYYLEHPQERLQQGAAARASATGYGQFGWNRSATEWLAVFREGARGARVCDLARLEN